MQKSRYTIVCIEEVIVGRRTNGLKTVRAQARVIEIWNSSGSVQQTLLEIPIHRDVLRSLKRVFANELDHQFRIHVRHRQSASPNEQC